jgi:hypothetical protein
MPRQTIRTYLCPQCGGVIESSIQLDEFSRDCAICGAVTQQYGGLVFRKVETEEQSKNHDPHYQKIEKALGIESTAKLGEVLFELRAGAVPDAARLNMDKALKYIIRAGLKEGQPWEKDLDKAINFLTRAKTGDWAK